MHSKKKNYNLPFGRIENKEINANIKATILFISNISMFFLFYFVKFSIVVLYRSFKNKISKYASLDMFTVINTTFS